MENTPPKRILRQRHTPTPKMSERKKSLFSGQASNKQPPNVPATIDEDSDLGPMSPLQFSCSPSTYDDGPPFMRTRNGGGGTPKSTHKPSASAQKAPTDFRNIMAHLSPRKLSDQYEALTITPRSGRTAKPSNATTMTNNADKASSNLIGTQQQQHQQTTDLEKENISAEFVPMTTQNTPKTIASAQANAECGAILPRFVHRKSLIFGDSNPASTPETPLQSAAAAAAAESSRARASLRFAEQQTPVISARSFYGSNAEMTNTAATAKKRYSPPQKHAASVPLRKSLPSTAHKSDTAVKQNRRRVRPRHSMGPTLWRAEGARRSSVKLRLSTGGGPSAAVVQKAASAAAAAAAVATAPSAPANDTTAKEVTGITPSGGGAKKFANRAEVVAAAWKLIENHAKVTRAIQIKKTKGSSKSTSSSPESRATDDADTQISQVQIDKLQNILRNQRNIFELASKPLNWIGGGNKTTTLEATFTSDVDNTFGHMSALDSTLLNDTVEPTSAAADPIDEPSTTKCKFFKSSHASESKHQYTVLKGMHASVKRGSGVMLLSPPPQNKRPRHNASEYAELHAMREEITGIISMLEEIQPATKTDDTPTNTTVSTDSDAANADQLSAALKPDDAATSLANYNRFLRQLPYQTDDPEIQERQQTLLNLLYTNNICNEHTFRIFIMEPKQHEAAATHILDQLFQLDVVSEEEQQQLQPQAPHRDEAVPMDDETQCADMDLNMEPLRVPAEEIEAIASVTAALLSPASQISSLTGAMDLGSPDHLNDPKLFPIFNRSTADPGCSTATTLDDANAGKRPIAWRAYGRDAQQLQIDAGQKRFGGAQCSECGMFYARHEPEDEALHQRFHDVSARLQFRGWQEERLVCTVPEWGRGGRILCVTAADAKAKRTRVAQMLAIADEALGVVEEEERMGEQNVIYLAIARSQVVGICVAEPRQQAHRIRMGDTVGSGQSAVPMMDLQHSVPVRCGLSRLWVLDAYRRHGIGRQLYEAVCSHFCRSMRRLGHAEVAFGAPTEAGCQFASKMVGGMDRVLVY